jgi:hypothetical protein
VLKAFKNSQPDHGAVSGVIGHEGRLALIEEIARSTESSLRTWGWLRTLSHVAGQRELDAILYPSTMAGASALIHRLDASGVEWLAMGSLEGCRTRSERAVVAVSLRLLDENLLFDGERIRVHAGYSVSALAYAASERGLTGLEPLIQMQGSLGDFLRPGRKGELWHLVEEVVIARNGVLKIILTRGGDPTPEQRLALDGALLLAATLKLDRLEHGAVRFDGAEMFPSHADAIEVFDRHDERNRGRPAPQFQLEFDYDADVWRDDS